MAWVTLAIRKQELKAEITNYDNRLLQISRETRRVARHKMTQQSIFNSQKQRELNAARQGYTTIRDQSPLIGNNNGQNLNSPNNQAALQAVNAASAAFTEVQKKGLDPSSQEYQTAFNALQTANSNYNTSQNQSGVNSQAYQNWQQQYSLAREQYSESREAINDLYDGYLEDLEADAADMQSDLEQEQVQVETILASLRAELESVDEQAKTEIKDSAVDFGS